MLRIVHNHDWVIFSLLSIGFLYAFTFRIFLREISLKNFFFPKEEHIFSNMFLVWFNFTIGYIVNLCISFSQLLPSTSRLVNEISYDDWILNKIGFSLLCITLFQLFKFILSFIFISNYSDKKFLWKNFYFQSSRAILLQSIFLFGLNLLEFYGQIEKEILLYILIFVFGLFLFIKCCFFLFSRQSFLPNEWYYKILYICTVQILPEVIIWKFLFL